MPDDHTTATLALRAAILAEISDSKALKATELVAKVVVAIGGQTVDQEFSEVLDALIEEGEIVEIEYVLDDMDSKIKSFLLPKGARLRSLRNGKSSFIFTPTGEPAPAADEVAATENKLTLTLAEMATLRAELEDAHRLIEGWEKVVMAKDVENQRLRQIIMTSDDGVTPE